MRRRALLLIFAVGLCAAASEPAPFAPVRRLYASLPRPASSGLMSRRLRALLGQDAAQARRRLDFEWRSGGETRPEVSDLHLRLARTRGRSAVVEASFYNHGERRFRRFFLVQEDGRWVVDDALLVPENVTLLELLHPRS